MKKRFLSTDHPSMHWILLVDALCVLLLHSWRNVAGRRRRRRTFARHWTHSPARLQILLLLACASRHTCDDYHDDSLRVSHRLHLPTLAMSKDAKPDVLGTRFPRHADGPQSTTCSKRDKPLVSPSPPISLCVKLLSSLGSGGQEAVKR